MKNIERKRVAAYAASCLLYTILVKKEDDGDCRRFCA